MENPDRAAFFSVIEALPDPFRVSVEVNEIFRCMAGATIVRIGTTMDARIEGGGLIIDYRLPGQASVTRLVLGLNELGMWVEAKCCVEY